MKISHMILLAGAALALAAPAPAQDDADSDAGWTEEYYADDTMSRLGLRTGWTSWDDVNQMHVGVHYLMGELFPNVELTPNIEVGFGDGATIWAFQGDLTYQFTEFVEKPWGMYGGASLAFNVFDYDVPDEAAAYGVDGSDTDLGLSLVAGGKYDFSSGRQGMFELRLGVMDSPDFKFTVGTTLF